MVGDCVIAHFGPPFYERRPGERLADALRCAKAVRDMTRRLPERPGLELLSGSEVGVATGVNLCPLFVGRFGPNDNFTGFSRGMNNAARLQGCATRDEILVMAEAIPALGTDPAFKFGPERSAKVKNVAEPLRFRALLDWPLTPLVPRALRVRLKRGTHLRPWGPEAPPRGPVRRRDQKHGAASPG